MRRLGARTDEMLPPVRQGAGNTESVCKCEQFDCLRLADLAARTDGHAGSVVCVWPLYYACRTPMLRARLSEHVRHRRRSRWDRMPRSMTPSGSVPLLVRLQDSPA